MAKQVWTNVRYFVGPADLTGWSNRVEVDYALEEKETTNFGSGGAKEYIAGIESAAIAAEGFWEAGGTGYPDDEMWAAIRTVEAHTICPNGATVALTSAAYLTQAVRLNEKLFGAVGDVASWTLAAASAYPMARGVVLQNPGTAISSNSNGTGLQFGALSATQRPYATLHVLSVSGSGGPTLAVTIESDDNAGFSSPTTQLTFTTASAVGSELKRGSVGAITDTYWRAKYVVTGSGPSFLALVAFGVANN